MTGQIDEEQLDLFKHNFSPKQFEVKSADHQEMEQLFATPDKTQDILSQGFKAKKKPQVDEEEHSFHNYAKV